jgi:hypothetical protein
MAKKGLAILIGVGKPGASTGKSAPPKSPFADAPSADDQDPTQQGPSVEDNAGADPQASGAKASRDEAGFVDGCQNCGACKNFSATTGQCSKVEGNFCSCDSCLKYFEPANPNADQDDQAMGQPESAEMAPTAGGAQEGDIHGGYGS